MTQDTFLRKKTMEELQRKSAGAARNSNHFPVWIVLDNVRSMHNVGSVFRTSDAFNVEGIALCGRTPVPPHREIRKTALGATDSVLWKHFTTTEEALAGLQQQEYAIWAVEQTHHSRSLKDGFLSLPNRLALVFGNEVTGVSDTALALCSGSFEIPQWGAKHSLNLSVSVGVALWELVRQYVS